MDFSSQICSIGGCMYQEYLDVLDDKLHITKMQWSTLVKIMLSHGNVDYFFNDLPGYTRGGNIIEYFTIKNMVNLVDHISDLGVKTIVLEKVKLRNEDDQLELLNFLWQLTRSEIIRHYTIYKED
jgi:hypothetical protein